MGKNKEKASFKIEIRSSENDAKKYLEGIIPYDSPSVPIWGTVETINRGAFNKTLSDKAVVRALFNHDDSKVLGSTDSGTLALEDTEVGLVCRCELPNTSYAEDLYEIVKRGDVKTMSFGFQPIKFIDSENGKKRTLTEVKLLETSFGVIFPAYPETTSVTYMRGLQKRNIDVEKLNEILEKEKLEDGDVLIIKKTVDSLRNLLGEEKAAEIEPLKDTQEKVGTLTALEDTTGIQLQIEAEISA